MRMSLIVLLAAAGGSSVFAADEPPLLEKAAAVRDDGIEWIDGTALPLEGRSFDNAARPYARLPEEAFAKPDLVQLRPSIPCPAGMCFRFTTDSDVLRVRWTLGTKPPYGICNATAILTAGIDVYRWIPDVGWRFWDAGFPRHQTNELVLVWKPDSPCTIHLPISTPLVSFQLGVRRGAKVAPLGPRTSGVTKPVVVYGASLVHGFSSSRPGMVWTSILSRRLDVPVVNHGYQGHGKMEPSMCEYLSAIDASAYCFLACGGQLTLEEMRAKTRPFLERLHRARPDVPILVGEYYYVVGPHRDDPDDGKRAFVRELVAELKASDPAFWSNLFLVTREELFCADEDGTIDAAHFNDRGADRCAEAFGKALKKVLRLE